MYYHYIFMFSDYEHGTRRAYYKSFIDIKEARKFREETKAIKGEFKNVKFSLHKIMTDRIAIESVQESDEYFKDIVFYTERTLFEKELVKSIKITPSDILKYILIEKQCKKLKAMKLLYLVYEEYFEKTKKYLFDECFQVWKYGPVAVSAYYRLDNYKYEEIKLEDIGLEKAKLKLKMQRVLEYESIKKCVEDVVSKYGEYEDYQLVEITHKENKPWFQTKKKLGMNAYISKKMIEESLG